MGKKQEYPEGHTIVKTFDNPLKFLEWASKTKSPWKNEQSSRDGSYSFTETDNYDDAYALAKFGWRDGLKQLAEQVELADMTRRLPKAPRKKYDVYGQSPAPARAAAGEMFSMVNKGRKIQERPIVKIRTSLSYNCNISTTQAIRWGAAMCSYIKSIEEDGFAVQLVGAFEFEPGYSDGPNVSFQIQLKAPEQRMSLTSMVFWLAHPSALRRIGFAALESLDIQEWYTSGYGRAGYFPPKDNDILSLSYNDSADSIEECLDNIREKHEELNTRLLNPRSKKHKSSHVRR